MCSIRAEVCDVALERISRDLHNLAREAHAADAVVVLLLVDRLVALLHLAHVRAHLPSGGRGGGRSGGRGTAERVEVGEAENGAPCA